ncbi:hypothetical protein B0H17DRAFT_1193815 [Mycena rosella]|uniref:Uncharacterized protein n=1 Tax=Mycena rosella TaxID=1033263 RepID=A0AAD7M7I7_MYCRO|nr:hypothetical protein B0H17DRAFT_1193815 [Mycena rosella]
MPRQGERPRPYPRRAHPSHTPRTPARQARISPHVELGIADMDAARDRRATTSERRPARWWSRPTRRADVAEEQRASEGVFARRAFVLAMQETASARGGGCQESTCFRRRRGRSSIATPSKWPTHLRRMAPLFSTSRWPRPPPLPTLSPPLNGVGRMSHELPAARQAAWANTLELLLHRYSPLLRLCSELRYNLRQPALLCSFRFNIFQYQHTMHVPFIRPPMLTHGHQLFADTAIKPKYAYTRYPEAFATDALPTTRAAPASIAPTS